MLLFGNSRLGACRHAASHGRIFPAVCGQLRTVFTIPKATKDFLRKDDNEIKPVELLLATVLGRVKEEALKTPEEIHVPRLLNRMNLLSGDMPRMLNESSLALAARHATITSVAASFTERKRLHLKLLDVQMVPNDRFHNPLSAVQSSPGGGKSTLLDIVGYLSSRSVWSPRLCPDDAMRAILNRSIPVPITFNSDTPWSPTKYDTFHERALALRILHSFFAREGSMSLGAFSMYFSPIKVISSANAIHACRAYMHMHFGERRDNLLLLVDEARTTAGETGTDTRLFSTMGEILDSSRYNHVNILSTTLDTVAFMEGSTSSGRPIIWSSLDKLPQEQVEDMFLRATLTTHRPHLHKLPLMPTDVIERRDGSLPDKCARAGHLRIEGSKDSYVLPPAVRIAISDCAGHPRSLEKMQDVFFELLREYTSPSDWTDPQKNSLSDLRKRVLPRLTIVEPSKEALRVALEGKTLPLDALVGGTPFSQLIAKGVFLNTGLGGHEDPVPKLSMLSLLLYTGTTDAKECIAELAKQEEAAVVSGTARDRKPNTLEGKLFEMFMARWLELRLRVAVKPVTICDILHLPLTGEIPAAFERDIPVRKIRCIPRETDNLTTLLDNAPKHLDSTEANKIVLLGRGRMPDGRLQDNPAFDIAAVLQCRLHDNTRRRVALFLETRFSAAAARTMEGQGDIDGKLALFDDVAKQVLSVPALGLEKADIVYVSVLNRQVEPAVDIGKPEHFLEENVIVLDREKVREVLTHSLADRALFLMDLRPEIK